MERRNFRRSERPAKRLTCSCGGETKLIKRRNFPHGRKSDGISYMVYKCSSCKKESSLNRTQEVRR